MDKKTLTIVLCQTRESSLTYNSLEKNLLQPLKSDLAFCGSAYANSTVDTDLILKNSQYIWNFPEPLDWAKACDEISEDGGEWRELAKLSPMFLGGTGYEDSVGSGIIIMYWREILRANLTREIFDRYDWFVITRSDFFWKITHPNLELLNKNHIYLLDGERHGGISDRHIIFHKMYIDQILSLAQPIFQNAKHLKKKLQHIDYKGLNPEIYLDFMVNDRNLSTHLRFLPYLGYTIRRPETETRWSIGVYNAKLGLFIKYPEEFRSVKKNARKFRTQKKWKKYLKSL